MDLFLETLLLFINTVNAIGVKLFPSDANSSNSRLISVLIKISHDRFIVLWGLIDCYMGTHFGDRHWAGDNLVPITI